MPIPRAVRAWTVVFLGCLFAASAAAAPDPPRPTPPSLRLPAGARPVRYALDLAIDPTKPTFEGSVTIDLTLDSTTSFLWLHAKELEVRRATITANGRDTDSRVVPGNEEFLGFAFSQPVPAGPAVLRIEYTGPLDAVRSHGIYRVQEPDSAWYAYTFFEPVDARRAFPCFDEPSFKVPWRLTIRTRSGDVAVANAPLKSSRDDGGSKVWTFGETKPLPSYLVAFVVGPFEIVDAGTAGHHGTPLRFVIPRGRSGELRYAREVTPKIVGYLEDFFGMPYPYGKLDVAVPPRYWGTMEHPGIVAMGQPLTLIKPDEETVQRKQSYANILSHELAHYWFGDYVTLAWWDETWLNEALAFWIDKEITHRVDASWRYRLDGLAWMGSAMSADALVSTKAIRQPVRSHTDIESSFDAAITYAKGAFVLGMFEHWVGKDVFRRGILRYLKNHAWGNAVSDDLLAALSVEAGHDVATPFRTFLDQPGVPLISAALRCDARGRATLRLTQKRFLPVGSKGDASQTWQIPVCVRYGKGSATARRCVLLSSASQEIRLDGLKECPEWVVVNDGAAGYYRVKYEGDLRGRLQRRAGTVLSPAEKVAFLADVRALVEAGELDIVEGLNVVPAFAPETDRFVVSETLRLFGLARRDILPDSLLQNYARAVNRLFGPRAKSLGWTARNHESVDAKLLRPRMATLVAVLGHDEALVKEARVLADRWLRDRTGIDAGVVSSVLGVAAAYSDRPLFERYLAEARRTTDQSDRRKILGALGSLRDPVLASEALGLMLQGPFDLRDLQPMLLGIVSHQETREMAYIWVKEHYSELFPRLRDDEQSWMLMIPSTFCDSSHRKDAEEFFGPRAEKIGGGPRTLAKSLEEVDLCIVAQERNLSGLESFLKKY